MTDIIVSFLLFVGLLTVLGYLFGGFVYPLYGRAPFGLRLLDIIMLMLFIGLALYLVQMLGLWPGFTLYRA